MPETHSQKAAQPGTAEPAAANSEEAGSEGSNRGMGSNRGTESNSGGRGGGGPLGSQPRYVIKNVYSSPCTYPPYRNTVNKVGPPMDVGAEGIRYVAQNLNIISFN
jgi:hypothetical protein